MANSRNKSKKLSEELFNFKSFQDSQIDILNSISGSLKSTLESNVKMKDSLTHMSDILKSIASTTITVENDRVKSIKDYMKVEDQRTDQIRNQVTILESLNSRMFQLANTIAETANRYSQLSNELIRISGASSSDVRDTRTVIVQDIVAQLNKETGWVFNPEKAYEKVIQASQEANIGSLEAIEAISRPLLLASESMNINNAELTSLLGKWYTKYNFSSGAMETMLDDIRGNTAGNNATAEETMRNLKKFENFIGIYADSEAEMLSMSSAISSETSRLSSAGINTEKIFDYLYQIGTGDMSNIRSISTLLSSSGSGIDFSSANSLLRSGSEDDMKLVMNALAEGALSVADKYKNQTMSSEVYRALGQDPEFLMEILSSQNALLSQSAFEASVSPVESMVTSVDKQFNTAQSKLENHMSRITEVLANLQETIGLGISDMLIAASTIITLLRVNSIAGGSGGAGGSLLGRARAGMSGLSAASVGKFALKAGGVGIGGALAVDGIKGLFDEGSSNAEKLMSGAELSTGIAGGIAVAINATNPVGWTVLAAGGAAALGKFLYKETTKMSGNAEKMSSEISTIGETLKKENDDRLTQLSELNYQFKQANDNEEKLRLLRESGFFSEDELRGKSNEALQAMITSYMEASKSIDKYTDYITKASDKYYSKKSDEQQSDFISKLLSEDLSNQERVDVLNYLKTGVSDESTLEKIDKVLKNDKVSNREWKKILKSSLTNNTNLSEQTLGVGAMQLTGGYLNWDDTFTDIGSNKEEVMRYYMSLQDSKSKKEFNDIVNEIESKGLTSELEAAAGITIDSLRQAKHYKSGSNYISSNQLAMIHEGEAVVPKKYNPAANTTELEMLRNYYKDSNDRQSSEMNAYLREFTSTLTEIKEFLAYWRDDNIKRETVKDKSSRFAYETYQLSRYNLT